MTDAEYVDHQEHLDRLRAMEQDHGQTWDLSQNDQLAIKYALKLLGDHAVEVSGLRTLIGELAAALEKARIKLLQHLTPSTEGHFRRGTPEDVDWYFEFERIEKELLARAAAERTKP